MKIKHGERITVRGNGKMVTCAETGTTEFPPVIMRKY